MRVLRLGPAFVLAACFAHTLPHLPSEGGRKWHELTSEHFVLWTDLSVPVAQDALRHYEDYRAVILDFLFKGGAGPLPARSLVIVVADWKDWRLFGDGETIGYFASSDQSPFGVPHLAYAAKIETEWHTKDVGGVRMRWKMVGDPVETMHHELGHLVIHSVWRDPPTWLDEGLAGFFSTARFDAPQGEAQFGSLPDDLSTRIGANGLSSVSSLVFPTLFTNPHQPAFYLRSQLLVAYLLNEDADRFATYQRLVKQLPARRAPEAWREVFTEGPWAVEHEVDRWSFGGRPTVRHFKLPPRPAGTAPVRELDDGDVLVVRAILYLALGHQAKRKQALAAAQAAVAAEPTNVLANILAVALTGQPDRARADRVAAVHPDDWRAWLLVALAARSEEERRALQARMCKVNAADPTQVRPRECDNPAP